MPCPVEADGPAVLGLRRDPQAHPALQRRHGDLGPEQRLVERDWQLEPQIVTVAREQRMRLHLHLEVQIAARGLTREADALAVAHAARDLHAEALRRPVLALELEHPFGALVGLQQGDLDRVLDVRDRARSRGAPPRAVARGRLAEAALVPEHRLEEVREVARPAGERIRARRAGVDPLEAAVGPTPRARPGLRVALPVGTKLVVALALVRIAQDLVGLVDLFELLRRVRRLIDVGMELASRTCGTPS